MRDTDADVVVVGAGPNGLAAAVSSPVPASECSVLERNSTPGGGARTAELTEPGFRHDVCSAVHPLALASPSSARSSSRAASTCGCRRCRSRIRSTTGARASPTATSTAPRDHLGRTGRHTRRLMRPARRARRRIAALTGRSCCEMPDHPLLAARFGLRVLEQGRRCGTLVRRRGGAGDARAESRRTPSVRCRACRRPVPDWHSPLTPTRAAGRSRSAARRPSSTRSSTTFWPTADELVTDAPVTQLQSLSAAPACCST